MDSTTWIVGAGLVALQIGYVWLWSRRPFHHPISDTMLMAAGGVLIVVAAFATRVLVAPLADPVTVLVWYVICGGAPELVWALRRRDTDTTAALASAADALRGGDGRP